MENHLNIFFIVLFITLFGLFSKVAEKSPITGPMFFLSLGALISPIGLDWIQIDLDAHAIQLITELTLIVILFVDASYIKLQHLKQSIPVRLLFLGLPLTMILGTGLALVMFPQFDFWLLAALALILSPTDAALGQSVVKSEKVPLKVRESISTESGLNDGISLPPIFMCLAVISSGTGNISNEAHWLIFIALQLTLGPLLGGLVGYIGGKAVEYAAKQSWMNEVYQRLTCLSIAILAYSLAETFGGNGFIATFCAGLFLGVKNSKIKKRIQEFGETEGQLLSLFVFFILGLAILPKLMPFWQLTTFIYAALSLTLIRIIPVFICLVGSGLSNYTKFFIAWFGPRGIASILYLLIAIEQIGSRGHEQILSIIVLTVLLSTFAHGITAVGMSNQFSRCKKQHCIENRKS